MIETTFEHTTDRWQQGDLVDLTITDLSDSGDGVGRSGERVVFVPDTVTGDRVRVRLVHVKPTYAHGKLVELLERSPHRIRPHCIVADKCGGCQWQHVSYEYQREAKRNLVVQALERIGGFEQPPVDPVLAAAAPLSYRNKVTFPLGIVKDSRAGESRDDRAPAGRPKLKGKATAERPDHSVRVVAGYYQKGSHHIVNLNQCPIQDDRFDPLLTEIKQDIQRQGWRIYDEVRHSGNLRHLALRVGRRTGERLLTLIVKDWQLPGIEEQAQAWLERYPGLVGVLLNRNPDRTNAIFGSETRCIAGRPYLHEEFAGLTIQIRPETFFQVNTEQAEALLQVMLDELKLTGTETIVDAYCGIGTLTLPLAKQAKQAIGIEVQPEAIEQARQNAAQNHLDTATFQAGTVEDVLPTLDIQPDVIVLDPPRKGCDRSVLETLLQQHPQRIVYMSCNPATLARDLKILCAGGYRLTRVQPADFFPQTAHVECVAFLSGSA